MAENGVRTTDIDQLSVVDELLGNRDGSSGRVPVSSLAAQLAGGGVVASVTATDALAGRVATLEDGQTTGMMSAETWDQLLTYTPTVNGTGGFVHDDDTGGHQDASLSGYVGPVVDNAGQYRWNLSLGLWKRIGANGVSAKADQTDLDAEATARIAADDALGAQITALDAAKATAAQGARADSAVQPGDPSQGRPGAVPDAYGETLTGFAYAAEVAPGETATTGRGAIRRLSGAQVLGTRERFALSPGDFYEIAWALTRSTNPADPNGDTVRCGIQWLNQSYVSVGQLTSDDLDLVPTVADGRQFVTIVIGEDASAAGVDFEWPSNAVYAVPFVQTYGSDGVTDVELLEWRGGGGALASDTVVLSVAGSGNAITATADRRYSDEPLATLFVMEVVAANTGAVTLSIGGETPKDLLLNTGEALKADYLVPGMSLDIRWHGWAYRLTTGASATAIEAAAAASAAAAAVSASASESSSEVAETAETAALLAQSNAETARDQSQASSDLSVFAAAFDAAADLDGTGLSADDYVVVWADENRENKVAIFQWNGSSFDFVRIWQGNGVRRDAGLRNLPYRIAQMQSGYGYYDGDAVTGDMPVIAMLDSTSNQPWGVIGPILRDMIPNDVGGVSEPEIDSGAGNQGTVDIAIQSLSGATVATDRHDVWPTGELIALPAGTYTVPTNVMGTPWATAVLMPIGATGGGTISATVGGVSAATDLDTSALTENVASIWEVTNPTPNTLVTMDITVSGGTAYFVHAWSERTDVNRMVRHGRFRKGGTGLENGWSEANCRANFRTALARINPVLITYHDRATAAQVEEFFPLVLNDIFTATTECDVLTIGGLPIFSDTEALETAVLDQNTLLEFYADQYFENGYPSFYVNPYDSYLIGGDPERAQTATENAVGGTTWRDATGTHWTAAGALGIYSKVARIFAALPVARVGRSLVPQVIGIGSVVRNASASVLRFVGDGTYGLIAEYYNTLKFRDGGGVVRMQLGNGNSSNPNVLPDSYDMGEAGSGQSVEFVDIGGINALRYNDIDQPSGRANVQIQLLHLRSITKAQAATLASGMNGNAFQSIVRISDAANGYPFWYVKNISGSPTWVSLADGTTVLS